MRAKAYCAQLSKHDEVHDQMFRSGGTPIDADVREQILKLGPYQPEGNFQKDAKGMSFSSPYYSFISKAGQKIERKWLCYSTRLHVAYCQVCWHFADRTNKYFKEAWCKESIHLTSKALQSPKLDLENAKTILNSSLTSIENLRNNFANIKEETIGLAKNGVSPRNLKKRDRKVRQFFDDFNADEKLQDRERLFEVDVFKGNVDVITTQLKNRFESMNGMYKSFSLLSPKNIVSTINDLLYNEASNLKSI
ncbi:hypothetical protein TNCV_3441101 [Trichonephila clavipes]|uniref:Uncharacterized protein n=1 Tax=Trichonephila clavipes TaxID=2585209 RepID=A0A8X7BEW3_TRICX|nr:hypothetical protein TNCV_3441101 [Trichonephila clavipes]